MLAARPAPGSARRSALAALVCAALTIFWIVTLDVDKAWAWDEAMHAELPAVRLLLSLRTGDLDGFWTVVHSSQQYPFGWPLVLAAVQGLVGISEFTCRAAGLVAWGATLFGVFQLAVEVGRAQRPGGEGRRPGDDLLPWLALALAATSPLALGYAQSLFLEVPSALVATWALWAWLRRRTRGDAPGAVRRELVAGALLTAAFFTKFNYGTLLIAACALDELCQLVSAQRAGRLGPALARLPYLLLPLVLGLGWWLVLPLPYGLEMGAEHRRVLFEFLGSNQGMAATPWERRVVFWALCLCFSARVFLLVLGGALVALRELPRPGARLLWIGVLVMGVPVWTHHFHLDRFLVPAAPVVWTLAALGLARQLPLDGARRRVVLPVLALFAFVLPTVDGKWLGRALGLVPEDPAMRAYVEEILASYPSLGPGRRVWTPGIPRTAADELLGLAVGAAQRDDAVGWIGNPTEVPPAALHLALFAAHGNAERLLRDAHRPLDVSFNHVDPGWSDAQLAAFAERFDVILTTDPPDLAERSERAFLRGYSARLVEALGWRPELLGRVSIPRDSRPPLELALYALRPPGA